MTKTFFKLNSTTLHFPENSLENTDKIEIEVEKVNNNLGGDPKKKIQNFLKSLVLNFEKNYTLDSEITKMNL